MKPFQKKIEVRWADVDANNHLRHSAYADICAHTRIAYLADRGLDAAKQKELAIGPVLFKEQTEYFKEVDMGEVLTITVEAGTATESRKVFVMVNKVYKP